MNEFNTSPQPRGPESFDAGDLSDMGKQHASVWSQQASPEEIKAMAKEWQKSNPIHALIQSWFKMIEKNDWKSVQGVVDVMAKKSWISNVEDIWNMRNEKGLTPLMVAARANHWDMVDALCAKGASWVMKDEQGFDALSYAFGLSLGVPEDKQIGYLKQWNEQGEQRYGQAWKEHQQVGLKNALKSAFTWHVHYRIHQVDPHSEQYQKEINTLGAGIQSIWNEAQKAGMTPVQTLMFKHDKGMRCVVTSWLEQRARALQDGSPEALVIAKAMEGWLDEMRRRGISLAAMTPKDKGSDMTEWYTLLLGNQKKEWIEEGFVRWNDDRQWIQDSVKDFQAMMDQALAVKDKEADEKESEGLKRDELEKNIAAVVEEHQQKEKRVGHDLWTWAYNEFGLSAIRWVQEQGLAPENMNACEEWRQASLSQEDPMKWKIKVSEWTKEWSLEDQDEWDRLSLSKESVEKKGERAIGRGPSGG